MPQVLPSEKKKLNEKATKMANTYAWIVYYNKSIGQQSMGKCSSFMQFKSKIIANQKADKFFYESILLFSAKCLKDAFDNQDLTKLEEEISRLFRSNAFNITERKLYMEERKRKYPQLKEPQAINDKAIPELIESRLKIPKESKR